MTDEGWIPTNRMSRSYGHFPFIKKDFKTYKKMKLWDVIFTALQKKETTENGKR